MNFKDKLIRRLLDAGKKHRILVYPSLAVIAVISAISHAIYWGKGNGRKLVASVMVMVLLVTQSLFLTSSADNSDEPGSPNVATVQDAYSDVDVEDEYNAFGLADADGTDMITDGSAEDDGTDILPDSSSDETADMEQQPDGDAPVAEDEVIDRAAEGSTITINLIRVKYDGSTSVSKVYNDYAVSASITLPAPTPAELNNYAFGESDASVAAVEGLFLDEGCTVNAGLTIASSSDYIVDDTLNLYYRAKRLKYDLKITDGDSTVYTGAISGEATGTPHSVTLDIGSATDYNAYKRGYVFSGLSYSGVAYDSGATDVTLAVNPDEKVVVMESVWTPINLKIKYDAMPDGTPSAITLKSGATREKESDEVAYNSNITLPSAADMENWAGNEAYYLAAWETEDGTKYEPGAQVKVSNLAKDKGNVEDNPNVETQTIKAVWEYKNVSLVPDGDTFTVSEDKQSGTISGTYGDVINCTVKAEYKKDLSQGTKFSYEISPEDINKLGAYGLGVTANSSHGVITSYTIAGTLKDVTDGTDITLKITDANKDSSNITTHTITLVSDKRKVSVDQTTIKNSNNDGSPSKMYDGTNTISINKKIELLNVATINGIKDSIYVNSDSIATLDDANAGTGKAITISGLEFVCQEELKAKYELETPEGGAFRFENIAEVMKMPLTISVELGTGESGSVLFGQDTPSFTLKITDPTKLAGDAAGGDEAAYNACVTDNDYINFMRNKLGFTEWELQRTLYSPTGTYSITPKFDATSTNYTVNSGASNTFSVGRDTAAKDTNYKFSTEKGSNGYYPGLVITATGNYDKIRLIESGESDIAVGTPKGTAEGMFRSQIIVPDMVNGVISFQMLDSSSGAITTIETISGLNVDTSGPVIVSHSVSPNISYFNEFNFGSYYHSQSIDGTRVESITIKVEYESEGSACDKLHYYFVDEAGNTKGDIVREVAMVRNALGRYEGTITVGTGSNGQIIVYASDSTGNESARSKLKLSDIESYASGTQRPSNYYEWMVENVIESSVIVATDSEGNVITGSDTVWYNELNFETLASDLDSGINKLEWIVTNPDGTVTTWSDDIDARLGNVTAYGKVLEYTFKTTLKSETLAPGKYTVSAILYDNAGNNARLDEVGGFMFDCKKPVITDNTSGASGSFIAGKEFDFTVTEGADESQVASVKLYMETPSGDVELKTWGPLDEYNYFVTSNGTYKVVAADNAGNVSEYVKVFSGISDELPNDPSITVDGTLGLNGWYIERMPYVTIYSSSSTTNDNIPVTTNYTVKVGDKDIQRTFTDVSKEFQLTDEGVNEVTAWAVSASNCMSDEATATIKVDLGKPEIDMDEATADKDGNVTVNFRLYDTVSGINASSVKLNNNAIDVKVNDNGAVVGSFKVTPGVSYEIYVEDNAGNSDTLEFNPLDMKVSPITDITSTSAKISAEIYEGTYEIADSYIAYRVQGESTYDVCPVNKHTESYGMSMDYEFINLTPDTVYEYKVYAVTRVSKETKVVEGTFKTSDGESTASVYGSVVYANNVSEDDRLEPIYVALYEGNTYIAGKALDGEGDFNFTNIADGNYSVVATNGKFTRTKAVTVENGGISYPADYIANRGINFVLSGLSTHVILEDGAVKITADGLEQVYDRNYTAVITERDWMAYDQGASIDVSLYASYLDVTDVSSTVQSVFKDKLGEESQIVRYIEIYVVKTVKDEYGNCINDTPANVTRLVKPVTIAFPLGDLSGQNISVASLHQNGSSSDFNKWTSDNGAILTENYVIITTDRFSLYALYKAEVIKKSYTVTWKDGDGNIMKTETVFEGEAATPPAQTPTKSETSKYTYEFSGWDLDYKNITGDTIISAWFIAHKKEDPTTEDPTTENPTTEEPTTEDPTDDPTTDDPVIEDPTTEERPSRPNPGSPNTGDEAPIVAVSLLMIISMSGVIILKKKKQ